VLLHFKKTIDSLRQTPAIPWPLIGAVTMLLMFVVLAYIFGK
jgi:hypothetical protein